MSKGLRAQTYELLHPHVHTHETASPSNNRGRYFEYLLIAVIIANVAAVMLETVKDLPADVYDYLVTFELVSVTIFTVEYLMRLWASVEDDSVEGSHAKRRFKFVIRPLSIIDLLAILPFYLSMFFALDLRVLRLLRLTRLFKLGRYSRSMQMLINTLRTQLQILAAASSVLIIIMVIAATGMYYLERHAQPDVFTSIPAALWWAVVTLTTVGYGDVVPVTPLGKVFGGVITMIGVGIFALPAGILASSFTAQIEQRRGKFRRAVIAAMADGKLTNDELKQLIKLQHSLELDENEMKDVIQIMAARHDKPKSTTDPSDT